MTSHPPTEEATAAALSALHTATQKAVQERNAFSHGWAAVGLSPTAGNNEHNLRSISQTLRVVRSLGAQAPLTVRDDELADVGRVLDLTDPGIVPLAMHYFSLDKTAALSLLSRIHQATTAAQNQLR